MTTKRPLYIGIMGLNILMSGVFFLLSGVARLLGESVLAFLPVWVLVGIGVYVLVTGAGVWWGWRWGLYLFLLAAVFSLPLHLLLILFSEGTLRVALILVTPSLLLGGGFSSLYVIGHRHWFGVRAQNGGRIVSIADTVTDLWDGLLGLEEWSSGTARLAAQAGYGCAIAGFVAWLLMPILIITGFLGFLLPIFGLILSQGLYFSDNPEIHATYRRVMWANIAAELGGMAIAFGSLYVAYTLFGFGRVI